MMETWVWWDINRCPIPDGYDARRVRPCIESALEKLGYSGPLTIFAMGNLKRTPHHVLRALASTGIVVNYITCGMKCIWLHMRDWTDDNPPPARIMFISNSRDVSCFSPSLHQMQESGYNILLAYPETPKQASAPLVASAEWLWKSLLKEEEGVCPTRRQPLQDDKCSETAESSCFFCTLCHYACQSLEDFTTHLKGKEHQLQEFGLPEVRVDSNATMVKKQLKRKFKEAGLVDSTYPMNAANTVQKKLSKRRKRLNKRRTE